MAEVDLIYKITILNLISKADYPLRQTQITDFMVENGYTDFFTVKKNIGDLIEANMISVSTEDNDAYTLTVEGSKTLRLLYDRITPSIEEDTVRYFKEHGMKMLRDNSLIASYDGSPGGGYEVHLKLSEDQRTIMDITLHVLSRDQAEAICMNWRIKYDNVYDILMDELIS
ncbi:MAG: DUF4364 family protein [Lachnospiraceae bacterium]|nr:DUF4364 family protein [Lachnospiraceae bacterium]